MTLRDVLIGDGTVPEITLTPVGTPFVINAGDSIRGIHAFDTLKLRNTRLLSYDKLTWTTKDADVPSTIVNNASAPSIDLSKISIVSNATSDSVVGVANAVVDSDKPVKLTITNTNSGATFPGNAANDGSFSITVGGQPGDHFTLTATDSHTLPLTNGPVDITSVINETNGVASLTLMPTTLIAGNTATGTITLIAPARAGGITVSLSSTSPSATVPGTLSIAAGVTTSQFTITAPGNAASATADITAAFGIAAKTVSLTVLPAGSYTTTVSGRVIDERRLGVAGATVTCNSSTATSASNGTFSIANLPVTASTIACSASVTLPDATTMSGNSATAGTAPNGTTNIGDITVKPAVTVTQISKSAWGVDGGFNARILAREGNRLVVGTRTSSDRITILDVSNPAAPAFVRTVSAGNGEIYDIDIANGWAFIASYDLCAIDITSTTSSKICSSLGNGELSVVTMNGYAFASTNHGDGHIRMYDVAYPPAPKLVQEAGFVTGAGYVQFEDMLALPSGYVVAIATQGSHDVVVIDVRQPNYWAKVADLDIPNFTAFRGRMSGNTLYLGGNTSEVVAVDLTNPASPQVLSRTTTSGLVDETVVVGNEVFGAATTGGLAEIDVTSPSAPFVVKTIPIAGGPARDVQFLANYAYVANDAGLAVVKLPVAPQVDASRIKLSRDTVNGIATGSATAATGAAPITLTLTNATTGATLPGVSVAANGSFTASIPAAPSDRLTVTAFDVAGRSSGAIDAGTVPFGTAPIYNPLGVEQNYRSRSVETDGSWIAVARWGEESNVASEWLCVFDMAANPANPTYKYCLRGAVGEAYDYQIVNGWAYVASWDFCTVNLTSASSPKNCVGMSLGDVSVAVTGGYAFVGENSGDGRVRVYNVTNPASPSYVREQTLLAASQGDFYDLIPFGANNIIAIQPGTHDVVIFDKSNINSFVKLADVDIPNFAGFRGHLEGNLLYIAGFDKMAIVDVTTPSSPVIKKVLSVGRNGISAAGSIAVVADGMLGASFLNAADPTAPVVLGRERMNGNVWDVLLRGGNLYAATEQGLAIIPDVLSRLGNTSAPAFSNISSIIVKTTATGASVFGPAGSVSDPDTPIQLSATNVRTSVAYPGTAAGDGSFDFPVTGNVGDTFTLRATDSHPTPLTSAPINVTGAIVNTVASLTLAPSNVAGGQTSVGTVTLASTDTVATTVTLSSNSANAVVPASVVVPANWSGGTQFNITTTSPASQVNAVITATIGSVAKTANLTVVPAGTQLTSLTIDSPQIEGGYALNGRVTLAGPASASGAIVSLNSSDPNVVVPASITVPSGVSQATFTIVTKKVGANVSTLVSGIYGATASSSLLVKSCPPMTTPALPTLTPMSAIWIDDSLPSGASATGAASFTAAQAASGAQSITFSGTGVRHWTVSGLAQNVAPADNLSAYVLVNPCDPPRQILFTWYQGATEYRATFGESRIEATTASLHARAIPAGGVWTRFDVIASSVGITTVKTLTGLRISVDGGEAWFDRIGSNTCSLARAAVPEYLSGESVWFDDSYPAGAVVQQPPVWDANQAASGTLSARLNNVPGGHETYFFNASTGLTLGMNDVIVAYVLVDPCNPPRELMLQFNTGNDNSDASWSHSAYWGENLLDVGVINSIERRRMGPMPETGKWIRLEVPVSSMQLAGKNIRGMALTLYDGQAWLDRAGKVTRVNLAQGKTASQSSKEPCADPCNTAGLAIDGDVSTYQHTTNQAQAWWQVDLGSVQPIESIDVWNGGLNLCCQDRMQNFWLLVSDVPFTSNSLTATLDQPGVTAYYHLTNGGRPSTFDIARQGRYVRVQLAGTNYLHAAEVQVWGPLAAQPASLAAGQKATASSTYVSGGFSYPASLAVNGMSMSDPFHTNSEANPWWQVDLGSVQPISTIDVSNVTWYTNPSCCSQRMTNFYLFVSD
ncbi:MAG TPA: discoidin domain-containing protein, partial [Thermoanaerobaculia bacterium]|nr:discoidin domain-containing protein [Thermoanaerobaculia bacterium]